MFRSLLASFLPKRPPLLFCVCAGVVSAALDDLLDSIYGMATNSWQLFFGCDLIFFDWCGLRRQHKTSELAFTFIDFRHEHIVKNRCTKQGSRITRSYTIRYRRPEEPWSLIVMIVPSGADEASLQLSRLRKLGYSVMDVSPSLPKSVVAAAPD